MEDWRASPGETNPRAYAVRQVARALLIQPRPLTVNDFYAYMPMHQYIFMPTGDLWPASSVDVSVASPVSRVKSHIWLDGVTMRCSK